jgi:hypothetical protein
MDPRNALAQILSMTGFVVLSGCASFSMEQPKENDVVKLPAKTRVTLVASPSMTGVVVMDGNSDVSNQINYVSDGKRQGDLILTAGTHKITAAADVPCWYCYPRTWRASSQASICVALETWPAAVASTIAVGKSNSLSWTKTNDTTIGIAADIGTAVTRWHLVRTGGITQSAGLIQSTENSCLCMRSMDDAYGTAIGLAICDANDHTQIWDALPMPNTNGNYRVQNIGRSVSSACLTQGPSMSLVQRSCLDTDDQLWRFKDSSTGQFVSPF